MYFVIAAFMIFAGVSSQNLGVINNMNINRRAVYPFVAMNQNGNLRNQVSIPFSYVIPSGSQLDDRLEERVLGASFNPTAFQSGNVISENALGASLNTLPQGFFPTYEQALGDSINRRNEQALGASINYLSGYQRFASGLIRPYSPLMNMNVRAVMPFHRRYQQNEGVLGARTTLFTFSNEAALGASIIPYMPINNLQRGMGPFSLPTEGVLGDRISFSGQNGWMRQVLPQNMYLRYPEQALGDSISLTNQRDDSLGDSLGRDEQVLGSWTWPFFYRGHGYGRRLHGYKRRAKY